MRRFGMAKIYMPSQRVPLSAVLSISSKLVIQLDNNLRIVFTNESFLDLIGTDEKDILGKNIEYTPVTTVFDDSFSGLLRKIRDGLDGKEDSGDISLPLKDLVFFSGSHQRSLRMDEKESQLSLRILPNKGEQMMHYGRAKTGTANS
jgi:PAS domain-containing protein